MFVIRWFIRLVVFMVLVLVFLAASVYLFVFPHLDRVTHADAVVVLSGGKTDRLPKGLSLMQRGVAPTLVISDGHAPDYPEANRLCRGGQPFKVVCFKPNPYSTRGEAEGMANLAREHRWRSLVVVTSRYHVFRARILFRRCFKGPLTVVGSMPSVTNYVVGAIEEWPKLIYEETLVRSC